MYISKLRAKHAERADLGCDCGVLACILMHMRAVTKCAYLDAVVGLSFLAKLKAVILVLFR